MMGLSLTVGIMADLRDDAENAAFFRDQLELVNQALHHAKVAPHHEPDQSKSADVSLPWKAELGDYKVLHYLRRLAAYVCLKNTLPEPGDDDSAADPINEEWCIWATNHQPQGLMPQLLGDRVEAPVPYEHLMVHSDAEGFYVPERFHRVVIASPDLQIDGSGLIGSSAALADDCKTLAAAIGLPIDLDPCSKEMLEAMMEQGEAESGWQRYGRESFACLTLYRAAVASVASGCAIVFRREFD